jgi:hypothetical protein
LASRCERQRIEAIGKAAKGIRPRCVARVALIDARCAFAAHGCAMYRRCSLERTHMLILSIVLEAAVAIIAVLAARRRKPYLYGLAFTFGAYVVYDLARLLHWDVQEGILSVLFLLATVSALFAVWGLYRE